MDIATTKKRVKVLMQVATSDSREMPTQAGVNARNELCDIGNQLTNAVSAFKGSQAFDELLSAWTLHQYRPSLWQQDPAARLLADVYDFCQKLRGEKVEAFRTGPTPDALSDAMAEGAAARAVMENARKHLPHVGDKVTFSRGMYGRWPGTLTQLYTGRASRDRMSNQGIPMAVVRYGKRGGGTGEKRVAVTDLVDRATMTKYDVKEER